MGLNDAIFDGIVEAGYTICGAQRPFSVFVLIGSDLGIMRRNSGNEDTSCGRNTTGHDRELIDDAFLVNFIQLFFRSDKVQQDGIFSVGFGAEH